MTRRRADRLRWAVDTYLTIRVSTLGFTWLLPLVGASAAPGWRPAETAWLLAVALSFHVFAYVLNDVTDLWVDRTEPLRADSPLVRGEITRAQALVLAWAQVPLAFVLALAGGLCAAGLACLAVAFGAMTIYDLYGKRCRWPLLTDAVQAAGWCALPLVGVWGAGARPGSATLWITGYVFFCVMLINGVHGGLRDLVNDHRRGARSTAVWFGARAGHGTAIVPSRALTVYAVTLQLGLVACAAAAWQSAGGPAGSPLALAFIGLALAAACGSLVQAFRRAGDRRALVAAGARNIVATLLVPPAAVLPALDWASAIVLFGAFGLPLTAMWAYNGSHWCLARPSRANA